MTIRNIVLLGDPILYQICTPVKREELGELALTIQDMRDTLLAFRDQHGVGRAIAAPQIGVLKRLVFLERVSNSTLDNTTDIPTPLPLINPIVHDGSKEMIELWDDCMSFPNLLVRLRRHATCELTYRDLDWQEHTVRLTGDLSELLQHECDHLDGVLAVSRAIDARAFAYRQTVRPSDACG